MSQPTREEVEAFIAALNYGMKVSHKPEFLIALAEGWLNSAGDKIENKQTLGMKNRPQYVYASLLCECGGRMHVFGLRETPDGYICEKCKKTKPFC